LRLPNQFCKSMVDLSNARSLESVTCKHPK
jgi:hypothetical protein